MKIAIIGTGYVGLVSGICFAEMGNDVICVDNNQEIIASLQQGNMSIYEPGLEIIFHRNIREKRICFTDDLHYAIENSAVIFLCLPTPQGEDGSADLHYVSGVASDIGTMLKKNADYKIIVNKSTVPVGTAQKVKQMILDNGGKCFDVASNPEFLREGFAVDDFMKPDRIVIGSENDKALDILEKLYEPFVRQGNPIIRMNTESSEVTKYAANSYLAMRITYMNELANFCEKVGANIDLVRIGMGSDTRIGKRFLFPGIGYGGSCFPKDVNALIKTSQEHGSEMSLLSHVDKVNKTQKLVIVSKIIEYFGEDLSNITFGIWGLAFKPNTDDMREAPSIYIIKELQKLGATVKAFDPEAQETAKFYFNDTIEYSENIYSAIKDVEALLILTEWNAFRNPDFKKMKSEMKNSVIFDGRNIFDISKMMDEDFDYFSIGRNRVLRNKNDAGE